MKRGKLRADIAWIRSLARPYLKGYKPLPTRRGSLLGYWFLASTTSPMRVSQAAADALPPVEGQGTGFFVGYLTAEMGFSFLAPASPECLIFAWVHPQGGLLHQRIVRQPGALLPKTFEYIRWLTHRPPRFVFYQEEFAVLTRHQSMQDWPQDKWRHFSQNFFIETLAWLVRSGLVRTLNAGEQSRG